MADINKNLADLRETYALSTLSRMDLLPEPIEQFTKWFSDARSAEILEPNAMTLSTVSDQGIPSSRIVLLKEIESDGIVFYTNYESHKAKEIEHNNHVAACFLWKEIQRQVRIEGVATKVPKEQSEKYFQSRPKKSQIGAWASEQSRVIEGRDAIEAKQQELTDIYKDHDVLPLPPFWGGYKITITSIEFWQGRRSRLHDRFRYSQEDGKWIIQRLRS